MQHDAFAFAHARCPRLVGNRVLFACRGATDGDHAPAFIRSDMQAVGSAPTATIDDAN